MSERIAILNGRFDPLTLEQTVDSVFSAIQRGERGWLATVNVAILMMMRRMPRLQAFVDEALLVVADGQPLVWVAPWFGGHLPERVTGVDLVERLCQRAASEGIGVYLLGATAEVVGRVAECLLLAHPGLRLDTADGYFSDQQAAARAEAVRASGARLLIVGMGVPRQEYFLQDQWERLGVTVAIGVGGSFDVLAGLRRRAPLWMQRGGLEWVYRLIQEPRRLFMRYLVTNLQFLLLLAAARIGGRR